MQSFFADAARIGREYRNNMSCGRALRGRSVVLQDLVQVSNSLNSTLISFIVLLIASHIATTYLGR